MNLAHNLQQHGIDMYAEIPTFMPVPVRSGDGSARGRNVRRGAQIFDPSSPPSRAYTVASGEVLILRAGRLVDMVEAGELLDPRIWHNATAIAYTDCALAPQ